MCSLDTLNYMRSQRSPRARIRSYETSVTCESASLPDHRSLPNTMRSQRGLGLLLVSATYVIIVRVSLSYPAFEWARCRVLTLRLRRRRLRRLTAGGATGVGSTGGTASLIGHWRRLLTARSSVPNQQWSQSAAIIPDNTIIE